MMISKQAVVLSSGITKEEILRMKKRGINHQKKYFIDAVIIMLDYLEAKYGLTFEAVIEDIPRFLSDNLWIYARACEGEHAGEMFKVYFRGEYGCRDNFISILKAEELHEAFTRFIRKKFNDTSTITQIYGDYGYEISPDATGEQILREALIGFDLTFIAPDMSSNDFDLKVSNIVKYLKDSNIRSEGYVFCLFNEFYPEMTVEEGQYMLAHFSNMWKWREYIVTYN